MNENFSGTPASSIPVTPEELEQYPGTWQSASAEPHSFLPCDQPQFYMQDTRQLVGNCMLWWAKDAAGYTTDLSKAHVYTLAEVTDRRWRKNDVAWPKDYIDSKAAARVDIQVVDKALRCATQGHEGDLLPPQSPVVGA